MNQSESFAAYVQGNTGEWRYFLGGFMLVSLVFSEMGNLFLIIGIYSKKLDSITAKVIKALTLTDAVLGMLLILPSCVSMLNEGWIFGDGGCILQGLLSNTLLSSHCFLMLCLAIERFYMLVTKNPSKPLSSFCNAGIVGIFLLSGLLSGFPLLQNNSYRYMPGIYHCVLSADTFPLFINLMMYVIPLMAVTFFSILTLMKTTSCCAGGNRISVNPIEESEAENRLREERIGMARASLFPTLSTFREIDETIMLPRVEIRATIALSYLNSPLSVLYIIAFCLKTLAFFWLDIQGKLAGISLLFYTIASFIQPFILFGVSGALRKSFINFIRRRNVDTTPTHVFRLIRRSPRPREEHELCRDIPTFLRQSSAVTIHGQISSQVNVSSENCLEETRACMSSSSSLGSDKSKSSKKENNLLKHTVVKRPRIDNDRRFSLQSTNADSVDSMLVNVGASVESNSRWSVSTASVMTLNIPELQMPCSRPRSRITRVMSETTHESPRGNTSPTNSISSERLLKPSLSAGVMLSPKKLSLGRERTQFRSFLIDDTRLPLPPVEDVSSQECSPRESKEIRQSTILKEVKPFLPLSPRISKQRSRSFVIRMDSQTDSVFGEVD
ncbi:uncharacterized protein LOC134275458 [Saccostrea cucullata]|uniref:uncharacterized protein LOC134275458 n=1 Tax=Saccostrea cuccullata TaxID=36930 RepID=UPI002ED56DC5